MSFLELFKLEKDKIVHSVILFEWKKPRENVGRKKGDAEGFVFIFSERECDISLRFRAIRSSAVFGTRRKTVLRRKGFTWVPDLESFLKLREVGVSPYLRFTLCLRTL